MRFAVTLGRGNLYKHENLQLMKQLGCTDVIGQGPKSDVWEYGDLAQLKKRVENRGLRLDVFEDAPNHHKIIYNLPGREEQVENFCKSLDNVGAVGIKVIKLTHGPSIPNRVWRTDRDKPTRGGATSTAFDSTLVKDIPPSSKYGTYTYDQIWEGMEYLLKNTLPTAVAAGVRIAVHPDDPPIAMQLGFPRILTSIEAFDRLLEIYPSDNIGLLFCQGCFAEMGVNVPATIHHFGKKKKIFFVHFRNVKGSLTEPGGFQEIFHDDAGHIDMYDAMKAYYDVGFYGPMRPDHAPKVQEDDRMGGPDQHFQLAKVLALGYMKGLAHSIEKVNDCNEDR